jgi:tetratricopeptide (TPR) repeat protein
VSEEAVQLYRGLVNDDRKTYLHLLAASLDNRAALLAEFGRPAEALPMNDEAVQYLTELVKDNPAYLPNLAKSLTDHEFRLAQTGRTDEALPVSEEAAQLYRELVKDNWEAA